MSCSTERLPLSIVVLVPVLSFLLIKEGPDMRDGLLSLLNRPNKKLWGAIINDLDILLSRYVRALLLLSIATFVSCSIAFSLMGVPYSLLLAGVAGLLEFIPFAGPLAAAVIAVVVAGFSGYEHVFATRSRFLGVVKTLPTHRCCRQQAWRDAVLRQRQVQRRREPAPGATPGVSRPCWRRPRQACARQAWPLPGRYGWRRA